MSEPDVSGAPDDPSSGPHLLTVAQAMEIIDAAIVSPRQIECALHEADGLVLAEDLRADRDYPPFDKALMDGFAVRCGDIESLPAELAVIGTVSAGQQPDRAVARGQAIAVMTGAPMPRGADGIVPVEDVQRTFSKARILRSTTPGRYIARKGSDARAMEVVLPRGTRLGPAQLAVAASIGAQLVSVFAAPRVAVFSTGNEIVPYNELPGPAQIRDSNTIMLVSLLRRMGCDVRDFGICPDDPAMIRVALEEALEADVAFVTGGMSMGEHDHVPRVLAEMGVELRITKLKIKPGKPFVFGVLPHELGDAYLFGLPGNPLSGFVCTVRLASRLIQRLRGDIVHERWTEKTLAEPLVANGPREFYQPAIIKSDSVTPLLWKGSADVYTLARANGLLRREENEPAQPAGARVRVLEF
jgi:molybdopterin molybdotransferase